MSVARLQIKVWPFVNLEDAPGAQLSAPGAHIIAPEARKNYTICQTK